jgi:hypothetical protein
MWEHQRLTNLWAFTACYRDSFTLPLAQAGSNTSTVALRVVEETRREPGVWGYNWAILSLGKINTGTWSSRLEVGRKADEIDL